MYENTYRIRPRDKTTNMHRQTNIEARSTRTGNTKSSEYRDKRDEVDV